jgi:hypothetical protein
LNIQFKLDSRKQTEDLTRREISLETYKLIIKNVVKGRTAGNQILIIDEGQDCHPYEREIFYEVFKPENVLVSSGGQEQLIRFHELCNWDVFRSKSIPVKTIGFGVKSYRVKPLIIQFCNFIARENGISLLLESTADFDDGSLILSFQNMDSVDYKQLFSDMIKSGNVNGFSNLESLLVMDMNRYKNNKGNEVSESKSLAVKTVKINEYDVAEDHNQSNYSIFPYLNDLANFTQVWNGAIDNKQSLSIPYPNEVRVINYESCRGLEAWSVVCFNIDRFYTTQLTSDDAEKHLLHEGLILSTEQRSAMYAINWILMAATRSIDTLYLHMEDSQNDFSKLCRKFIDANSNKVQVRQ